MKSLPKNYDHKEAEPRLQKAWEENRVYAWDESQPRENTFVIDTPPPTVSGILHMGHIFSYTQADFIARYQRMLGKTVFYPMGFDDNGLPTERLVEKEKKVRGSAMPREEFVALCREVVKGAEDEFRRLFKGVALSVDWSQEYQTISDDVRKLSQTSFLDLLNKGEAYRDFRPTYWDWVDQTAIAQAEIENKEMPGVMNEILFTLEDGTPLHIATTRPELLGACVAVMYHPEDPNAAKYEGKFAVTPVFGMKVPMIADELVERDKGTGLVMCCTFGDDTDKEWVRKHELPWRPILNIEGRLYVLLKQTSNIDGKVLSVDEITFIAAKDGKIYSAFLNSKNCIDIKKCADVFEQLKDNEGRGLKPKQANSKMIELLAAEGKLLKQTHITHTVKCAERSGAPIEIIPTYQWFIKVTDKKEALKAKGAECNWYPEFMHIRLDQWINGLKEDWCISRQRFFGVPFPIWYGYKAQISETFDETRKSVSTKIIGEEEIFFANSEQLPLQPLNSNILPAGFKKYEFKNDVNSTVKLDQNSSYTFTFFAQRISDGQIYCLRPDPDIMDTWATSSLSPQINGHAIGPNPLPAGEGIISTERYAKLFPADLRPQAHEIIRTWAFYTIVKAHLHQNSIPWKNVMISGWCLASDKTKMSKSKGNVVTPVDLIVEKGADVVRYWASTSRLGSDTAFSEDFLKIGKKLVTKLWNATAFAAIHLQKIEAIPASAKEDVATGKITEALDKWILSRLHNTIAKATQEFDRFEYCDARVAVEEFFWKDFCDNYLELVKARAYGEIGNIASQNSAHLTLYHCLKTILRLFAPFIPHITEELYSHIFEGQGSIHVQGTWPEAEDFPVDEDSETTGNLCVEILAAVRKIKSEKNVSMKFPITNLFMRDTAQSLLSPVIADLKATANVDNWQFDGALPGLQALTIGGFDYFVKFGEQPDAA